jgi:hypothetical protein
MEISPLLLGANRGIPMTNKDIVGRCGIYCGACPIYRGTRGDREAKAFAKNVWKTPPNRMTCDGCHNLKPESHGVDCPRRECMDSKGYEYCSECPEYASGKCEKFEHEPLLREGGEPHENLRKVTSGNTDSWLEEQG